MESLEQALNTIIEALSACIDFLVAFIGDLVEFIALIGETVLEIPIYMGAFLPAPVILLITGFMTIAVLCRVIGRE